MKRKARKPKQKPARYSVAEWDWRPGLDRSSTLVKVGESDHLTARQVMRFIEKRMDAGRTIITIDGER